MNDDLVRRDLPTTGSATQAPMPGVAATAALALVLSLLVAVAAPAQALGQWIVDAGRALPASAHVVQHLPLIDAIVVSSPTAVPGGVPVDSPLRPEALVVSPAGGQLDSGAATIGAPEVWATTRGEQSVVALVDTGVAPVPALEGAVAGEIDFTGTGGGDGYGHGTFLASVIAGRGDVSGVAPGAGILSLKVSTADGTTTLGSVLSALQWLHGPGRSAGIRIATLAMAVDPGTDAAALLDRAVDRLAQAGVLVITAAGNDGPDSLTSPATAAGTFSVGAFDDGGTADPADDTEADFSGRGLDAAGVAQPDVLAPGVGVVGSLPPGSIVAGTATPVSDGLYSGSGTSMATAMVAGVAALTSSARPDLDGVALDAALRAGGATVDAPAALDAALAAPATPGRSGDVGPGTPPADNGNGVGNGNGNGNGVGNGNGNGNGVDPQSIRWTSIRWTSIRWTSIRWTGAGWGDASWGVADWGSIRWTGGSWRFDGPTPQSIRWTSIRWTWGP